MANSSIEDIMKRQCEKLEYLESAVILVQSMIELNIHCKIYCLYVCFPHRSGYTNFNIFVLDRSFVKDVLAEMVEEVLKISDGINVLREQLCKISDRNKECQVKI